MDAEANDQRKVAQLIVVFLGVLLLVSNLRDLEEQLEELARRETQISAQIQELSSQVTLRTPAPTQAVAEREVRKPHEGSRSDTGKRGESPRANVDSALAFAAVLEEALVVGETEEDQRRKTVFELTPMPPPPQNVYDTLPPSKVHWPVGDPNYRFQQTDSKPLVAILTINAQVGQGDGAQGVYSKSSWIYPMSFHNKYQYAKKWGYDLIIEDNAVVDRSRDVAWSKIPALRKWLPNYQWIMWMDMDAFFMRFDMDIEHILSEDADFIIGKDWHGVNMGVFFIRNAPYGFELLDELWNTPKDKWYPWEEQSALMNLLQHGSARPGFFHTSHFLFPPLRDFNSYPEDFAFGHTPSKYVKGDFIAHFPNCKSINNCRGIMTSMFDAMMAENMLPPIPAVVPMHHYPEER